MQRISLKDTEDTMILGIWNLTDSHVHWCIEGALNTATSDEKGFEVISPLLEARDKGEVTLKLSPLLFVEEDHKMQLEMIALNKEGEIVDQLFLMPMSTATAIMRGMRQPAWNQWESVTQKGDDHFGKGNWRIDWHFAEPLEDDNAKVSFILQGIRK
jgi:hypothetical protein